MGNEEINFNVVNEAYFDMHRSLIEIADLPFDFVAEPLIVGGEKMRIKLDKLSPDFGAMGDRLIESDLLSLLEIPEKDDENDPYDFQKADLDATILSDDQVIKLGLKPEKGSHVGVIESHFNKKKVFFRIPEGDVASLFVKEFNDESDIRKSIEFIKTNKANLDDTGIESIELGRIFYGLWKHSADKGNFYELDELCGDVIMEKIPVERNSIEILKNYLEVHLSNEADKPSDNWWLARSAIKQILGMAESMNMHVEDVCSIVEIVAEKAAFYPDVFWKAIVEPLVKLNYGNKSKLFVELKKSDIYTQSVILLRQVESVRESLN